MARIENIHPGEILSEVLNTSGAFGLQTSEGS